MKIKRRIGCFARVHQVEEAARLGFDSVELDLGELVDMPEGEFAAFAHRAKSTGLGFEAFSGLLPLTVRLHDPAFDWARWLSHIHKAAALAARLGGALIPFGAGRCRSIPRNCTDVPAAKERVRAFAADVCDVLSPYGIRLAVEPLGPANSNYLGTLAEAADFAKAVNRPNCFIMCDMRHMVKRGENWREIVTHRDRIIHAHIDCPLGKRRLFPQKKDGWDYGPYLNALDEAGYTGLLTAEALDYTDFSREAAGFLELITKL